jgi:cold shock CspA family protein
MAFSYFAHSFMDDLVACRPTYVGVVSSKQNSFGFIRSPLPTDTFFHKSVCGTHLFETLKVGDSVSFQLDEQGSKPGKRAAAHVTRSTDEPQLELVDQTQHYGRIVRPATAIAPLHQGSGVLRYVPAPGKVQHLTFRASDVLDRVSADELTADKAVSFKMLTDLRQQQLAEASGRMASPHAVHAYKRATQVTSILSEALVRLAGACAGSFSLTDNCL